MSFTFNPDAEMQNPERLPAKVAKTANPAAETGGTRDKLAALAISRPQNSKSEGPGIEVDYPPTGTFLEADERCPEAMAKPDPLWGRVAITEAGGRTGRGRHPERLDHDRLVNLPRYTWFVRHHGPQGWELDAMNPNDLRQRVADAIFENIDLDPWQRAELVERAERESFVRVMGEWRRGMTELKP